MRDSSKPILAVTALCGLAGGTGIALTAVAAHASTSPLLQTGARFMLVHAVAALAVAALAAALPQRRRFFLASAVLFLVGGLLFAIDLAAQALAGSHLFPLAAPLGATLVILGWAWLALASLVVMAARPE